MGRSTRYALFFGGGALVAVLFVWGVLEMTPFGASFHPYRDLAVKAAVSHATANVVSSVNFDQRAFDTFGEETIFFAAVVGAAALLRPSKEEQEQRSRGGGRVMPSTRLAGYLLLPLTLLVGLDVVAHGHVTPGGGFQGGVVLATGFHLLYVAGRYPALERLRPILPLEYGEVTGALAFAGVGLAGIAIAGAFLANVIPFGVLGSLLSAGIVEVLNFVVGIEVTCGVIVMLAHFFEQALALREATPAHPDDAEGSR
jgi:multicomponent Na+:H+ antiporter subunit B